MTSLIPPLKFGTGFNPATGSIGTQMNAAGESQAAIGFIRIPSGGSRTISAAGGGSIVLRATAVTFSSGSTNLRTGLQDVDPSTGFEDGTFDVQCDAVGGSFTINTPGFTEFPMTSGSKTLTDGDLVAIVSEMTARGATDALTFRKVTLNSTTALPYGTSDTGTHVKTNSGLHGWVNFDDGTIGWIDLYQFVTDSSGSVQTFNSGSGTPEYGVTFETPVTLEVESIGLGLANILLADTFQFVLYKDPYGSPIVLDTITPNPGLIDNSNGTATYRITPIVLPPGGYAITCLATSVNDISVQYIDLGSGFENIKQSIQLFGDSTKFAGVAGGVFTEVQQYFVPMFILGVSGFNSGGVKQVGPGGLVG